MNKLDRNTTTSALLSVVMVVGAWAASAGRAEADLTLQELFNGGSISALDKTFDNFVLEQNGSDTGNGIVDPFDLTQIVVAPLEDQPLNPGLLFTAAPGVISSIDSFFRELDFVFDVTSNGSPIKDFSLRIIDFVFNDEGEAQWAADVSGQLLNTIVTTIPNSNVLEDSTVFAPQQSLAGVGAGFGVTQVAGTPGAVDLRSFELRVSQVPEPVTLPLMLGGLASLGLMVRRKRRT